jgi:protein involved in polysaccharide export with SLBB domain
MEAGGHECSVDVVEAGPKGVAFARVLVMAGMLLALRTVPGVAQNGAEELPRRAIASRQELDELAARAEAGAASSASPQRSEELQRYATELRLRLREGDFLPGDQVTLAVHGDTTLSGTYTVQPSRMLVVSKLPPIPLHGVLRSELQPYLATRLRPFMKDTLMHGTALVRLGVLGEVARPGYYRVPFDVTLGDALMVAGGPTVRADVTRSTIRRGTATIMTSSAVREAMMRGARLGDLDVDAGDELIVEPPRERNWSIIAQFAGVATGVVIALFTARSSH